ncbi:hypothetical protein [Flavobacterium pectinovorum]|uniref:hypothetical protein n=1 Tax=Flavobacterium pectinovorum TaxID=29533 RepID=UPI001FABBFCC|nr:hypothetical protein [Flavobacterium pectinovorum]MCI9843514.1 hypothetical protein [Flavobacterium pectinovorum]
MKTIVLKYFILSLVLLSALYSYGQDEKPAAPKTETLENPLNKTAFHKNIMQDLNFMVLGDNNTKQGFSYEYNEKKTELSLSGALISTNYMLLTVDGSFSVDDGAFIFDNKDGSKKGSLDLNFFAPLPFANGKYYPAAQGDYESEKANRARYINHITEQELRKKAADTFSILDKIIIDLKFPQSTIQNKKHRLFSREYERQSENDKSNKILSDAGTVANDTVALFKVLKTYYKGPDPVKPFAGYNDMINKIKKNIETISTIKGKEDENGKTQDAVINAPKGLDLEKLFKDYDEALINAQNIDDTISDRQIKLFKDIWTVEYNTYFGLSGFYERESLDIYNNDVNIQSFDDRFKDTKGDLYGVKASLNHITRWKSGTFVMFRLLGDFGRGSNFEDFKKKDFIYNTNPEIIGGGTMVEEKKKTGYYTENGVAYTYGFLQKYTTELYVSSKVAGIYGKFGYSQNEALAKKETLPFETGIMINVNSDKKNVVSILLFVAREDLNVHPDLDTNFGFKIGLPINVRKSDKDKEEDKS